MATGAAVVNHQHPCDLTSCLGADVSFDQAKGEINAGKKSIWEGPIAKQDGTVVAPAGQKLSMEQVETMDYLIKGITGATK